MQLINSVAFAALGVGLLLGWQCDAKSVLLAYGGSCLIAIVWAGRPLRRMWRATPPAAEPMPRAALWARIAPYAAWVLLFSMLANVFARGGSVHDRSLRQHPGGQGPRRGGQLP